eukprot:670345_1
MMGYCACSLDFMPRYVTNMRCKQNARMCCWNRMQPILDFNTLQKLNVIDALCWLEIHFRCCDQKEIAIFDRWRCYPRYTYCQPSISCILNVHFNAFCFLMCNILAQSVH